jgi:hypothetical protein
MDSYVSEEIMKNQKVWKGVLDIEMKDNENLIDPYEKITNLYYEKILILSKNVEICKNLNIVYTA